MSIDTIATLRTTQDLEELPPQDQLETGTKKTATAHNIGAVAAFSAQEADAIANSPEDDTVRMTPEWMQHDPETEAYDELTTAMLDLENTKLGLLLPVSHPEYETRVRHLSEEVRQRAAEAMAESFSDVDLDELAKTAREMGEGAGDRMVIKAWEATLPKGAGQEITPHKAMMTAMAWDMTGADPYLGAGVQRMITKVFNDPAKYGHDGANMVIAYNSAQQRHNASQGLVGTSLEGKDMGMGNFTTSFLSARRANRASYTDTSPVDEESFITPGTRQATDLGGQAYSRTDTDFSAPLPINLERDSLPITVRDRIISHLEATDRPPLETLGDSLHLYHQATDGTPTEREYIAMLTLRDAERMIASAFHDGGRDEVEAYPNVTLASTNGLVDAISVVNQERPDLLPPSFISSLHTMIETCDSRLRHDIEDSPLKAVRKGLRLFEENGYKGSLREYITQEIISTQRRERFITVDGEFRDFAASLQQLMDAIENGEEKSI